MILGGYYGPTESSEDKLVVLFEEQGYFRLGATEMHIRFIARYAEKMAMYVEDVTLRSTGITYGREGEALAGYMHALVPQRSIATVHRMSEGIRLAVRRMDAHVAAIGGVTVPTELWGAFSEKERRFLAREPDHRGRFCDSLERARLVTDAASLDALLQGMTAEERGDLVPWDIAIPPAKGET